MPHISAFQHFSFLAFAFHIPGGTRYCTKVADDGTLSTEIVP
jgi:hypothetical protein